jgi:hypothetical protein
MFLQGYTVFIACYRLLLTLGDFVLTIEYLGIS